LSLGNSPDPVSLLYRSELTAYSVELQQIFQLHDQTLVVGGRYQTASPDAASQMLRFVPGTNGTTLSIPITRRFETDLNRLSFYAYEQWQIFEPLRLTAGISYDRLHYPLNIDSAPIIGGEATREQFSPKVGLHWSPRQDTHLRFDYTRSLGGVFFDQSVRLEPTQVGGFNQSFRSLIPESVVGLVPGTRFETFGLGLDQNFKDTGTYLTVNAELLNSDGTKTVGILTNSNLTAPEADSASSTRQSLEYQEKSLVIALHQLVGKEFSVGARYKLTHARLDRPFTDLPAATTGLDAFNPHVTATLNQVYLYANYYHPCGFFGQINTVWSQQSNRGYSAPIPGDDFWQYNVHAGYRFLRRRAEAAVGVLNLTDRDYRLNPLTLYNELPRERTFVASLKFFF
jgi:outer membrane receptor protein involved in Fe transport